jgi:hypothetical protein
VEMRDGQGAWQGLRRVELHLSTASRRRPIETTVTAYHPLDKESQK